MFLASLAFKRLYELTTLFYLLTKKLIYRFLLDQLNLSNPLPFGD